MLCVVLIALDAVVHRHHLTFQDAEGVDFPYDGWFGFFGIYGFMACVVLVLLAKELRKFVMRREDYYGD